MRGIGFTIGSVIAIGVLIAVVLVGFPTYNVYSKQMAGKAAYEEAVQNRRIRVLEAQAALDSAKLTAAAEIERAKGANEANSIMAQALGGPEAYLRWSYINMLQETAGKGDRQGHLPADRGGHADPGSRSRPGGALRLDRL